MNVDTNVAAAEGPSEAEQPQAPRNLLRELRLAMSKCTPKQRAWLRKLPKHSFQYWGVARSSLGLSTHTISKWLRDDRVKAVRKLQDEIATEDYDISERRILQEYTRLAFSDLRQAFDDQGRLLPPSRWPDDIAAAISAIDSQEHRQRDPTTGQYIDEFELVRKLKLYDKKGALEFLAAFKGMIGPKRLELTGADGKPLAVAPPVVQFVERAD